MTASRTPEDIIASVLREQRVIMPLKDLQMADLIMRTLGENGFAVEDVLTREVRVHSSDDMPAGPGGGDILEPVAVVLQEDGPVDVYGYVAVIDYRTGAEPS